MFDFDPYIGAAIFFSSFFLDLIAARYTYYVVSLHAERAAALSFLWHMVSAVVVLQYAQNAVYIVFVCLGGALGTYFTIWAKRRFAGISWIDHPRLAETATIVVPRSPRPAISSPAASSSAVASAEKPLPPELLASLLRANAERSQAGASALVGH